MSWTHDTLSEFGRQIGIPHLGLGQHGAAQLAFDSGGLLAVEPVQRAGQDEVLIYLCRPVGHLAAALVRPALAKAHVGLGQPYGLQVALRGSGPDTLLLALVRLPERSFTLPALMHTVDFLTRWLDEVQAGRP